MVAELSTITVEARALPAPNYMGLPEAQHIYLVGRDDRSIEWPCFGRGYDARLPGQLVSAAPVYRELATAFVKPISRDQFLGGILNTVNGTCHTLANRVMIFSQQADASVCRSVDDAYSVVLFGKYGFGTKWFCELLTQTVEVVKPVFRIPERLLDIALERARTPQLDELAAWKLVIFKQFGIDVDPLLQSSPAALAEAVRIMTAYCSDRDDVYEQCFDCKTGLPRTGETRDSLRTNLKKLALKNIDNVLSLLAAGSTISPENENALKLGIHAYIDRIG